MTGERPRLALVWAQSKNGVIGIDGKLPWNLTSDLEHFKRLTGHDAVLMGRATWDSLPARRRPLPGRLNLVLTRNPEWTDKGAVKVHTLEEACQEAQSRGHAKLWVIGGSQVYRLAMEHADEAVVTEVDMRIKGDAFAPVLDMNAWRRTGYRRTMDPITAVALAFVSYERAR